MNKKDKIIWLEKTKAYISGLANGDEEEWIKVKPRLVIGIIDDLLKVLNK